MGCLLREAGLQLRLFGQHVDAEQQQLRLQQLAKLKLQHAQLLVRVVIRFDGQQLDLRQRILQHHEVTSSTPWNDWSSPRKWGPSFPIPIFYLKALGNQRSRVAVIDSPAESDAAISISP